MSSAYVRNTVLNHLLVYWHDTLFYNLSDFIDVTDLDLPNLSPWLGVQFLSSQEETVSLPSQCFREDGIIVFHVVYSEGTPSSFGVNLCEKVRNLFRGVRLGNFVCKAIDPPTDFQGESLGFDGNWHGFAVYMEYYADLSVN